MAPPTLKHVHSAHLERWLGPAKVESLSRNFRDWYGPPVCLRDVPGSVWATKGGDFVGHLSRGGFYSAMDSLHEYVRRLLQTGLVPRYGTTYAGFASISDALQRASSGERQMLGGGPIAKNGSTGVINITNSLWRVGTQPQAGVAASAAPGGRVPVDSTAGGLPFANPSSGTLHLTGADFNASIANNSLLLYDRIFDIAKTMNSTATEAVTGVPTRYQSSTASAADYAGGNFLFPEVGGTALAATAHNWTVCLYTDEAGTTGQTLPSVAGVASAIADRLDLGTSQWFMPLAAGDVGIKNLEQMQCSAAVATGIINFVIGHPIAVMAFPVINTFFPFDWLTNRDLAPRIFDDACLSFLELPKPATTATTYTGMLYATRAAP